MLNPGLNKVGIDSGLATEVTLLLVKTNTDSVVTPTAISHALVPVVTAGTRVQLATTTAKSITVKATAANTGFIYVGGSTVSSVNGFPLSAGDTVSIDIMNTNIIWVDSSVSGETCSWISNV